MNREFLYLTAAVVVLAAIATLAIKGCSDKTRPVAIEPMKPVRDSVDSLHKRTQIEVDSLKRSISYVSTQRDSLKRIAERQSDELNVKNIKINAVTKEYSLYRKYKDTAKALEACDTLAEKVSELTADVEAQEKTNRALQNSNDSLVATSTFVIGKIEYENSVLKQRFDTLYTFTQQLSKDNSKLGQKAKQRFAVGPYLGATYLDKKIAPSGGLALTYALFKF